jgi:hypothetical protein
LERMGMVVFFSTTPCERLSSRTRSALLTVNSMDGSLVRAILFYEAYLERDKRRVEFIGAVETLISF